MNRDNQQETASEAEKAWLAGFIDGEGSVSIGNLMSHRKNVSLAPRLSIPNTDRADIEKVGQILDKILVSGHLEKRQAQNGKWKTCYVIYISQREKLKTLLESIIPYLAGKKERAELLLRFVDSRMSKKKCSYSDEEWEIVKRISLLNQKGPDRDPQRLDANLQRKMRGMKIKSDPGGDTGKPTEMLGSFSQKLREE